MQLFCLEWERIEDLNPGERLLYFQQIWIADLSSFVSWFKLILKFLLTKDYTMFKRQKSIFIPAVTRLVQIKI